MLDQFLGIILSQGLDKNISSYFIGTLEIVIKFGIMSIQFCYNFLNFYYKKNRQMRPRDLLIRVRVGSLLLSEWFCHGFNDFEKVLLIFNTFLNFPRILHYLCLISGGFVPVAH